MNSLIIWKNWFLFSKFHTYQSMIIIKKTLIILLRNEEIRKTKNLPQYIITFKNLYILENRDFNFEI